MYQGNLTAFVVEICDNLAPCAGGNTGATRRTDMRRIDQFLCQLTALSTGPKVMLVEYPSQLGGAHDADGRCSHAILA